LGVISPKTRISSVMTPVAIPTPMSPNSRMASAVAMLAAPMLATLLPIRMVASSRSGLDLRRATVAAPRTFFSTSVRRWARPRLNSAISSPEKKADSATSRTSTRIS